ncbi:uroporphyrinogen decarboxylase family protein [uncultured Treponema sp.]|uniref:uroporphyrinogen decarboxylase family protein n=1 Tax=uncultured Treponema sp. TaxID=162155 RepID=UPI0025D31254|nr:uroporphyrinogen decarboxylase family protein [uncultured Treponema sp.]
MPNKKQLVLDALNNKPTERVPVGFWFHYTKNEMLPVSENPEMRKENLDGHKKFVQEFKPDFVKLMSDGYFFEPKTAKFLSNVKSAKELYELKPVSKDDSWITEQVSLVKELTSSFGNEVLTFYNIFAPATAFKWSVEGADKKLAQFIKEDKYAVLYALSVIAKNTQAVAEAVISEGKADGIYLSVQTIQDAFVGPDLYAEIISPSELSVLNAAIGAGGINILHVCGYEGARNNLSLFKNYPANAVNFASVVEGVSLAEAKKIFGGKTIIGGFANTTDGILFSGTKEEIQAETKQILKDSGRTGIILGADCTIPRNTDLQHLEWIREAAE